MPGPNKALLDWIEAATAGEVKQLAAAAKTSVAQLMHYATGRRSPSAAAAQRIAHASVGIGLRTLDQRKLCAACAKCPLANDR